MRKGFHAGATLVALAFWQMTAVASPIASASLRSFDFDSTGSPYVVATAEEKDALWPLIYKAGETVQAASPGGQVSTLVASAGADGQSAWTPTEGGVWTLTNSNEGAATFHVYTSIFGLQGAGTAANPAKVIDATDFAALIADVSDKDGFTFVLPAGTALDAFAAPFGYVFRATGGDAYRLDESPSGIVYSADAYRSFAVDTVRSGPDRSVRKRNEILPFAYSGDAWKGSASAASTLTFMAEDGTTAHSESCTGTGTFAYELPKGLWTVTLSSSATNLVANIDFINGFVISFQ
jgi:hypothetical protein